MKQTVHNVYSGCCVPQREEGAGQRSVLRGHRL